MEYLKVLQLWSEAQKVVGSNLVSFSMFCSPADEMIKIKAPEEKASTVKGDRWCSGIVC